MMALTDLSRVFAPLSEAGVGLATAPFLALGVGVLLFLVCDIVTALKPLRPLVFFAALAVAFAGELAILAGAAERTEAARTLFLGGTLRVDATTALWGCIFLAGTLLAWVYSIGYYTQNRPFKPEHDALLLTAPAGMMLMVGAGDLIVFFIGLELLSIPLYALAAFRRARADSVEAGVKYFVLGSFSSALFLYGAALLYGATGTVALEGDGGLLAFARQEGFYTPLSLAGISFLAASLFFKVSVFPFHLWVPDVYEGSPTPVTALMATGTKAAAFGMLVRLAPLLPPGAAPSVAWIAIATMAVGNLGALVQPNLKRMLAYSGIAHAGTVLLVVAGARAGATVESATLAALYYMGAYLFSATGAFGVLSLLESDGRRYLELESLRGLARSRPGAAAALSLFMLSLGGIPTTGGFLGKWFVFSVLVVEADMIAIAVLGVLLSVVALAYYLRVIVVMYMQPAPADQPVPRTMRPLTAGVATFLCSGFVLAMGVVPGWFLGLLD
ncbi:MAG: NADH-quinone oxidoreductase subunit N [Planctomycetota bacterium]